MLTQPEPASDRALRERAQWLRLCLDEEPDHPETWMRLLLEAAAFAAALPALVSGRRCGVHVGGAFTPAAWPGLFHGCATACQACHGSGDLGWCDHAVDCWMSVDGGEDPAQIGACGCGALVTAPRWASMSPTGVECPICRGGVELSPMGPADRWAESIRLAGPPTPAEADELRVVLDGFARLHRGAVPWTVAAHAAALTRLRMSQRSCS